MDTPLLTRVNSSYQRLVDGAKGPTSKEQMEGLNKTLVEAGFLMKGKPFPTFLKPYFVEAKAKKLFEKATKNVMSAAEKIANLYFTRKDLAKYFELDAEEKPFVAIQPHHPNRIIQARLDAFYYPESGDLKFLEFNCDSPSGMGWHDRLVGYVSDLPVYKAAADQYKLRMEILLDKFHAMLMKKCKQVGIKEKKPTFAIVCDRESSIRNDVQIIIDFFNEKYDHKTIYADPRDGVLKDDKLFVGKDQVHLVYRDAIQEFTARPKETSAMVEAFKRGTCVFINPFTSRVGGLKCVLSFLTDERFQKDFTDDEMDGITKHIPWTRYMQAGKTNFRGHKIDLFEFVRTFRELFVLKPNGGYGGFGVTIGRETDPETWDKVLGSCQKESWVVQEFVNIPKEPFPRFEPQPWHEEPKDGKYPMDYYLRLQPQHQWKDYNVNVNFFAFDGEFGGSIVRVAPGSIINVHQGGGLLPMVYVEK